jgi:hypothetical protein
MPWLEATLMHDERDVPRDGLVVGGLVDLTATGGFAPAPADAVRVTDAAGVEVSGSQPGALGSGRDGVTPIIWRPDRPLQALASYTVHVRLPNAPLPDCTAVADIEATFEILTRGELTTEPPAVPLVGIAHGRVWEQRDGCCVPLDTSRCERSDVCLKCWSWKEREIVVPLWDAKPEHADPLLYALFHGRVDRWDMDAYITSGGVLPAPWLSAGKVPVLSGSGAVGPVCLSTMTRNQRTGQEVFTSDCWPIDPLARDERLGDLMLGAASLEPPTDPALDVGPAACNADAVDYLQGDDAALVAATYTSDPRECGVACGGMFDPALVDVNAPEGRSPFRVPPPAQQRAAPADDGSAGSGSSGAVQGSRDGPAHPGCSVTGRAASARGHRGLWACAALLAALLRRRARRPPRPAPPSRRAT